MWKVTYVYVFAIILTSATHRFRVDRVRVVATSLLVAPQYSDTPHASNVGGHPSVDMELFWA